MTRRYLFELEDQPWFPATIRNAMTEWLSFIAEFSEMPFCEFARKLAPAIKASGCHTLLELGSGGGGPAMQIAGLVAQEIPDLKLVVSDLYPNIAKLMSAAKKGRVPTQVIETPVDATNVPAELRGFRLMCNAFHHLTEDMALRCLKDCVAKRQGIAILEMVDRSLLSFLAVFLGVALMGLGSPFVKPFSVRRLFFTYIIPIVPIATLWDGFVSCLRVFAIDELESLTARLSPAGYRWDIGRVRIPWTPTTLTYLIGLPSQQTSSSRP